MKTPSPNMCKSEGPLTMCKCTDANFTKEQRNCIGYSKGKKGYCTFYRFSIGACSNYDGYFSDTMNR